MGTSGPKAPDPIDPYDQAAAQGNVNFQTALTNVYGNRINQNTPHGSLSYKTDGYFVIDPRTGRMTQSKAPAAVPKIMSERNWLKNRQGFASYNDYRDDFYANIPRSMPIMTQNVTLSKPQQQLLDLQHTQDLRSGNINNAALGRIGRMIPTDLSMSGLPSLDGAEKAYDLQQNVRRADLAKGYATRDLSFAGNPALPGNEDFGAERRRVEDALYDRHDRKFAEDEETLRTRLANAGVEEGSEAWNRQMRSLNEAKTDTRNQVIAQAGAEQSRLFGQALQARQQAGAEDQATTTSFNQNRADLARFGNQAEGQRFAADMQNAGLFNAGRTQDFQNRVTAAQLANQARAQGLQERLTLRQLPLNEYAALRSGQQIQNPQFESVPLFNMGAADLSGAMNNSFNARMAQHNQGVAQRNAMMNGMVSAGSSAAMMAMMSDMRLKRDIRATGGKLGGFPLYRFTYIWDDAPQIGVMAQEVERARPDLVFEIGGYKAVNYGGLII